MYSGRIALTNAIVKRAYSVYAGGMVKSTKTPVSVRMTDDELALLERAAKRFKGNKTKAIVEGLKLACGQNEMSKAALMAELDRRLK